MAVVTGALFKGFTFGGVSSKDYGVYISGDGVYNSPEKDVEMISVPGRNGAYALDNGRWLNITVEYPAGMFGQSEEAFADSISELRNILASKKGYQILEDDYHPGEFRLAVYRGGLEVTPARLKAGEFTISFDCKPQRFLLEGQEEQTVTSGGTITNPTLFDAAPLLMVSGYGAINFGEYTITISDTPIGRVVIPPGSFRHTWVQAGRAWGLTLDLGNLNTGDAFAIEDMIVTARYYTANGFTVETFTHEPHSTNTVAWDLDSCWANTDGIMESVNLGALRFTKGTAKTYTAAALLTAIADDDTEAARIATHTIAYDGNQTLTFSFTDTVVQMAALLTLSFASVVSYPVGGTSLYGTSSKGSLGEPLYFDLDIGEAYKEEGGTIVSVNGAVNFGAALPVLPPGETEITFPATVTNLQVVPRYWKL